MKYQIEGKEWFEKFVINNSARNSNVYFNKLSSLILYLFFFFFPIFFLLYLLVVFDVMKYTRVPAVQKPFK